MRPEDAIDDIERRLAERFFRKATVTAINAGAGTVTITIDGKSLAGIRRLNSYSPTVNDVVEVACPPGRMFVLGKLA